MSRSCSTAAARAADLACALERWHRIGAALAPKPGLVTQRPARIFVPAALPSVEIVSVVRSTFSVAPNTLKCR
jgi:hypothetical protein